MNLYFYELEKLKGAYPETLLRKFDKYLKEMPKAYQDRIPAYLVSKDLKITIYTAIMLLKESCKTGLLTEKFILKCPECDLVLKIAKRDELMKAIEEINYCYGCDYGSENLDLKIDIGNIETIFELNYR